jgi:hypothetical protein
MMVEAAATRADDIIGTHTLAVISFGESWHNSHHADPTCARYGVLPGQLDPAARLIWLLETPAGSTTLWPKPQRFAALPAMNVSGTPEGSRRLVWDRQAADRARQTVEDNRKVTSVRRCGERRGAPAFSREGTGRLWRTT